MEILEGLSIDSSATNKCLGKEDKLAHLLVPVRQKLKEIVPIRFTLFTLFTHRLEAPVHSNHPTTDLVGSASSKSIPRHRNARINFS